MSVLKRACSGFTPDFVLPHLLAYYSIVLHTSGYLPLCEIRSSCTSVLICLMIRLLVPSTLLDSFLPTTDNLDSWPNHALSSATVFPHYIRLWICYDLIIGSKSHMIWEEIACQLICLVHLSWVYLYVMTMQIFDPVEACVAEFIRWWYGECVATYTPSRLIYFEVLTYRFDVVQNMLAKLLAYWAFG
jgi:hypothetical protein